MRYFLVVHAEYPSVVTYAWALLVFAKAKQETKIERNKIFFINQTYTKHNQNDTISNSKLGRTTYCSDGPYKGGGQHHTNRNGQQDLWMVGQSDQHDHL